MVGLLFKVGAVPFHSWTPDVYQGAPTPVTGFMAACTKLAAFGAILRLAYVGVGADRWDWQMGVVAVAALTMIVGAVLSVTQTDVKRLLAYSSIAHAGLHPRRRARGSRRPPVGGVLFYLLAYGFMTIAAFAIVAMVRQGGSEASHLSQWAGLGRRHPVVAGTFAFLLLAFAGIPLTSGFTAKYADVRPGGRVGHHGRRARRHRCAHVEPSRPSSTSGSSSSCTSPRRHRRRRSSPSTPSIPSTVAITVGVLIHRHLSVSCPASPSTSRARPPEFLL